MRIAFLSTWRAKCGISTYTAYLARALLNLGHEVKVLAEEPIKATEGGIVRGEEVRDEIYDGIESEYLFSRVSGDLTNLLDALKGFDAVHIQYEGAIFAPIIKPIVETIEKRKIKYFVTLHSVLPGLEWPFDPSRLIVHTEAQKNAIVEKQRNKVHIIPHGVKLVERISEGRRRELREKFSEPILMTSGFIGPLKGIRALLDAMPILREKFPNISLVHVGGIHPVLRQGIEGYFANLYKTMKTSAFDRFKILGFVGEKEFDELIQIPDLHILNYFPTGILSASGCGARVCASGVPFICTRGTGRTEEFKEGLVCLKYDLSNIDEFIRTVVAILNDDTGLREELVKNAMEYARQNSWENVAKKHIELYEGEGR